MESVREEKEVSYGIECRTCRSYATGDDAITFGPVTHRGLVNCHLAGVLSTILNNVSGTLHSLASFLRARRRRRASAEKSPRKKAFHLVRSLVLRGNTNDIKPTRRFVKLKYRTCAKALRTVLKQVGIAPFVPRRNILRPSVMQQLPSECF